ncbi:hypothetical protein M407DRAFT_26832 [Tulasnella calospora MUT 4182]|uniref:Uncharacterized protein n=1 Tax=Tulasnella calospora MUT 4182 TaxID=1051891 RepID=A0A0C3LQJ2_9AGAM|nr:hypothetical protein M407DRAFT_26832 [Tulasnella calospora MUT 4182]
MSESQNTPSVPGGEPGVDGQDQKDTVSARLEAVMRGEDSGSKGFGEATVKDSDVEGGKRGDVFLETCLIGRDSHYPDLPVATRSF